MALIASSMAFSFSHVFLFGVLVVFIIYSLRPSFVGDRVAVSSYSSSIAGQYPSEETIQSRTLTDEQCRAAFPGLLKEVDDAVARGKFVQDKFDPENPLGPVRGRIKDGKASLFTLIIHLAPENTRLIRCLSSYTSSSPSAKVICPQMPSA